MKADVIVGMQWGDEGKGKIVDYLAPSYDLIARFQGGPNAGHTIEAGGMKTVLHTVPSGIMHAGIKNLIGNGVVIDPATLIRELETLKALGVNPYENLFISRRAHLILPTHRILDACSEAARGEEKIGTTLKGISPAYTDRYARRGIRAGDIHSPDLMSKYQTLKKFHLAMVNAMGAGPGDFSPGGKTLETLEMEWFEAVDQMKTMNYVDGEIFVNHALAEGKKVLAEGAQGTLLDIDLGAYPFVTSSHTIAAAACTGLGIPPQLIDRVVGVFKAYCTRVGSGPFPTELNDDTALRLRETGHEFGATTGRPRRCGWLDLPALKYSAMINGVTDLVMTKADVLDEFSEISVCTSYISDGNRMSYPPFDSNIPLEPELSLFTGWKTSTAGVHTSGELPEKLTEYLKYIENFIRVPVSVISLGPDRLQTIKLTNTI